MTVVIVHGVVGGERVAVGEEGHVALRLGQVDVKRSVAVGRKGATGKGTKNPLVVGLLNDGLFSPGPERVVQKKKGGNKDLKTIDREAFRKGKAETKGARKKR